MFHFQTRRYHDGDEVKASILASEVRKADGRKDKPNIFTKILSKEIEADIIYEDEQVGSW